MVVISCEEESSIAKFLDMTDGNTSRMFSKVERWFDKEEKGGDVDLANGEKKKGGGEIEKVLSGTTNFLAADLVPEDAINEWSLNIIVRMKVSKDFIRAFWYNDDFSFVVVESEGKSGGLFIIWNVDCFTLDTQRLSNRAILLKSIRIKEGFDCVIVNVYAPCETEGPIIFGRISLPGKTSLVEYGVKGEISMPLGVGKNVVEVLEIQLPYSLLTILSRCRN
ncbi:hypothetical protein J1N35_006344 [Gossypium stocksii]|uniref:Uncharacterized protein n=1 Tax=Gossypium stocksii TaxID=47602 RepID=A0A9D4AJG4_9ROSI|nr:hypothetical protein J1N35_006344 [Gossypium stocksii]